MRVDVIETGSVISPVTEHRDDGYIITIAEEIRRVLVTRKGSIPMNPDYGSDLWRYRDRTLDTDTRIGIIAESFEAIERSVKRVQPTKVEVLQSADGKFALKVYIEKRRDDVRAYAA
jgi:phage baseplate assembly protein W